MKAIAVTLLLYCLTLVECQSPSDFPSDSPSVVPSDLSSDVPSHGPTASRHPSSARVPTFAPILAMPSMPTTPSPTSCYSDLTVVADYLFNATNFEKKVITLCPNTTYPIGIFNTEDGTFIGGQKPLRLYPNTYYKCGEDGSSSNQCVLTGGSFQIESSPLLSTFLPAPNVEVRGLTFDSPAKSTANLGNIGDFTFVDCWFRKSSEFTAITILNYMSFRRRDLLKASKVLMDPSTPTSLLDDPYWATIRDKLEFMDSTGGQDMSEEELKATGNNHMERYLQTNTRQVINFVGCVFEENSQPDSKGASNGVIEISSSGNDVVIQDCTFQGNVFNTPPIGYAINVASGSTLTIKDTCFLNNDFIGNGTVNIQYGANFSGIQNYGTNDTGLTCPFAMTFEDNSTTAEYRCVNYDTAQCGGGSPTIPSPVAAPVVAPVVAPAAPPTVPTSGARPSIGGGAWAVGLCLTFATSMLFLLW